MKEKYANYLVNCWGLILTVLMICAFVCIVLQIIFDMGIIEGGWD